MAVIVRALRELAGRNIRPVRVAFAHARNADLREFERFFGCPVEFGRAVDEGVASDLLSSQTPRSAPSSPPTRSCSTRLSRFATWRRRSAGPHWIRCAPRSRKKRKTPAARQGAKANRRQSARMSAVVLAQARCRGNDLRGGRRRVAAQSGASVSQGAGHVAFRDRLAVGLRGPHLLQPCFQTLDRSFAVCGPQGEAASCAYVNMSAGSIAHDRKRN